MRLLLLLAGLSATTLAAQVGVNNANPEQALDVGGKVRIGDDATAPTEGTLRYNDTEGTFEGYDASGWTPLTNQTTTTPVGVIPAGALPVAGRSHGFLPGGRTRPVTFSAYDARSVFTTVPAGTRLIVTWVNVRDTDIIVESDLVNVTIGPTRPGSSGFVSPYEALHIHGDIINNLTVESSHAPLSVLNEDWVFIGQSASTSTETVSLQVRGFLIPAP